MTSSDTSLVSVISTATNTVTTTVSTYFGPIIMFATSAPYGVAITPNGEIAYVANSANQTVLVINIATNTIINTITGFNWPYGVAVAPNGAYVYVTNQAGGSVTVINTSNGITSPTPAPTASPSPSPTLTPAPTPTPTITGSFTANNATLLGAIIIVAAIAIGAGLLVYFKKRKH